MNYVLIKSNIYENIKKTQILILKSIFNKF